MKIKDVMTQKAQITTPSNTIAEAAQQMLKHDIGFLPVGENDRLVGTLTDRDIVLRCAAKKKDPNTLTVKSCMTENLAYCFENDDVHDVAKLMAENGVRRLPVLNDKKRLTGVVTIGDIAFRQSDSALVGTVLGAICEQRKAAA